MEKLLLLNIKNNESIKKCAANMSIRCSEVLSDAEANTIEELSKDSSSIIGCADGDSCLNKDESLLIFCDVTEKHMDKLLFEIKQAGINISYKAAMTPTNRRWSVKQLVPEMRREKFEYMRRMMK